MLHLQRINLLVRLYLVIFLFIRKSKAIPNQIIQQAIRWNVGVNQVNIASLCVRGFDASARREGEEDVGDDHQAAHVEALHLLILPVIFHVEIVSLFAAIQQVAVKVLTEPSVAIAADVVTAGIIPQKIAETLLKARKLFYVSHHNNRHGGERESRTIRRVDSAKANTIGASRESRRIAPNASALKSLSLGTARSRDRMDERERARAKKKLDNLNSKTTTQ